MRALPTTTSHADVAVIDLDDTGTATLHLDGQPVDHIVEARPRLVVQVLLDHTATVKRNLTVLTRYADGHNAVHQIHPDGAVALLLPPSTSSDPASPPGREHRQSSERTVRADNPQARALVATAWKRSRRWLVGHGLWLMLGAQILLLVGSITFIVVALAPYLWPRP
jgi:hypothetical protein